MGQVKRLPFKGRGICKTSHTPVGRLKITNGVTLPGAQLKLVRTRSRLPLHPCAQATESYPLGLSPRRLVAVTAR